MATFTTVDDYIASFPEAAREVLEAVRRTMREAAPGTEEAISYGIPTLMLDGRYVAYFSGWKAHLSVYPVPSGDAALTAEMAPYRRGAGTLRFPYSERVPLDLIGRVTARLLRQRQEARG